MPAEVFVASLGVAVIAGVIIGAVVMWFAMRRQW